MFIFWISYATYSIAAKYLLAFMDGWHLILWLSLGNILALIPFLGISKLRGESFALFRRWRFLLSAMMIEEFFSLLGRGALIYAYAVSSVALVSSVAALQPFLTLVYAIALGIFILGVLKEDLDIKTLSFKLLAFC